MHLVLKTKQLRLRLGLCLYERERVRVREMGRRKSICAYKCVCLRARERLCACVQMCALVSTIVLRESVCCIFCVCLRERVCVVISFLSIIAQPWWIKHFLSSCISIKIPACKKISLGGKKVFFRLIFLKGFVKMNFCCSWQFHLCSFSFDGRIAAAATKR